MSGECGSLIWYIVKRLLQFIPVVLLVLILVFTISKLAPGDPVTTILGFANTPEKHAQMTADLGLDRPFLVQLWDYIRNIIFHFDFGRSYQTNIPVTMELASRFPITLRLGMSSVLIVIIIGIPLGVLSAVRQYSVLDISLTSTALIFAAIPGFVLALILLMIFAAHLGWLPVTGGGPGIKGWILPIASSSMYGSAILTRMTRTTMLEVIRQDYIRTAKSKGLRDNAIIRKHALKNSLIPVITIVGGHMAFIIAGSIIVETIFAIPGVGMYLVSGIQNRDYPIINGVVILVSVSICAINLLVDISYAFIDPRIKSKYTSVRKKRKNTAFAVKGKTGLEV